MKKAEDHLLRFIKILVEREFSTIFELPFSIHNRDEIRLNGNKLRVILTGRKKRFRKICSFLPKQIRRIKNASSIEKEKYRN